MYLWVCVNIQLCFFTPPLTLKTLTNPLNQHFPITTLQCLFSNSFSFFTPPRLWSQGSWSPSARWLRPWIEVVQVKPAPASVACVLCTSVVCPQVTPPTPSVCSHVQYVCLLMVELRSGGGRQFSPPSLVVFIESLSYLNLYQLQLLSLIQR